MKIAEILLEYQRDVTAKNMGVQLLIALTKDSGNLPHLLSPVRSGFNDDPVSHIKQFMAIPETAKLIDNFVNNILEYIESKDPTQNKQYTQWLARLYSKGGLKMEDMNRQNILGLYDAGKRRGMINPEHADINKFKSYRDFEDAIIPYDLSAKLWASNNQKKMDKGTSKEVYKDANVRIVVPEDEAAACYYGQGTRWCTAGDSNNQFDNYNSSGKLYIMLPKHPEYNGEKYQLQFENDYYMDETDTPVSVKHLVDRFPEAMEFIQKNIKKFNKGEVTKVYEDADVEIVQYDTDAALYYGGDDSTSSLSYMTYYSMVPKFPKTRNELYKLYASGRGVEIYDAKDNSISVDTLVKRFPDTLEFFKKLDPYLNRAVQLTSDEEIDDIWTKLKQYLYKQLKISIDNEEGHNEKYNDYLKQNGYIDDAGDWIGQPNSNLGIEDIDQEFGAWKDELIQEIENVRNVDDIKKLSDKIGEDSIYIDQLSYIMTYIINSLDSDKGVIGRISYSLYRMLNSVRIKQLEDQWKPTEVQFFNHITNQFYNKL